MRRPWRWARAPAGKVQTAIPTTKTEIGSVARALLGASMLLLAAGLFLWRLYVPLTAEQAAAGQAGAALWLFLPPFLALLSFGIAYCVERPAPARVAAGPAALAVSTGAPLFAASIWYERLVGERRRRAGSPWGIVVAFRPVESAPASLPRAERVVVTTQAWVDEVAAGIAAHPEDWHMLQRVFVADLDPARDTDVATSAADRAGGLR